MLLLLMQFCRLFDRTAFQVWKLRLCLHLWLRQHVILFERRMLW
jgi:hypothetical protein